jgi:hypothetical protein
MSAHAILMVNVFHYIYIKYLIKLIVVYINNIYAQKTVELYENIIIFITIICFSGIHNEDKREVVYILKTACRDHCGALHIFFFQ